MAGKGGARHTPAVLQEARLADAMVETKAFRRRREPLIKQLYLVAAALYELEAKHGRNPEQLMDEAAYYRALAEAAKAQASRAQASRAQTSAEP